MADGAASEPSSGLQAQWLVVICADKLQSVRPFRFFFAAEFCVGPQRSACRLPVGLPNRGRQFFFFVFSEPLARWPVETHSVARAGCPRQLRRSPRRMRSVAGRGDRFFVSVSRNGGRGMLEVKRPGGGAANVERSLVKVGRIAAPTIASSPGAFDLPLFVLGLAVLHIAARLGDPCLSCGESSPYCCCHEMRW